VASAKKKIQRNKKIIEKKPSSKIEQLNEQHEQTKLARKSLAKKHGRDFSADAWLCCFWPPFSRFLCFWPNPICYAAANA